MKLDFKEKVYRITKRIPKGKVATYGQIARLAGNLKASRAVGSLMRTNPFTPSVPCHRVVGKAGDLHGYHWGLGRKKTLLEVEHVLL